MKKTQHRNAQPIPHHPTLAQRVSECTIKLEFHDADTDTDILARILADTSDTRDFLKLFPWQAVAGMSPLPGGRRVEGNTV